MLNRTVFARFSGQCLLFARPVVAFLFLFLAGGLGRAQAGITLVQHVGRDAGSKLSSSLSFVSPNTSGNWIAVCVRGGNSSSEVFTVTDTNGNAYQRAAQLGFTSSAVSLAIYYAENIKGGANTVTVSDTVLGPFRFDILEYSGVATSNSLDVTVMNQGTGTAMTSGNLTTNASGDLLLAAVATINTGTFTAGSGYVIEDFVPAEPNTKLIAEDQVQLVSGSASAGATLGASDGWGVVLAAFKSNAASGTNPTISQLSPSSGPVGTPVTISGNNFGSPQGTSTVTFNGTAATPTNWSTTSITVPVPSGATTGNVVVTVGGVASNSVTFTVTQPPAITGLNPTSGPVGTPVTISGNNFGNPQGTSTVTFNGTAATPTNWSSTSITVPVPSGATTGNVVVTVGGIASPGVLFTVTTPPTITGLNPAAGPVGTPVTITGTNFGSPQGTSTVTFNGTAATPTNWSATSITVPVPSGATTGSVVVTVGGTASNGFTFTVSSAPTITGLSLTSGPVGTPVTISGNNFGNPQGTSTVTFNGTAATPTNWSATSITVPVPSGATTGSVVVTVGGTASNGVTFTVTSAAANIALVQRAGKDAGSVTTTSLAFTSPNTAGNWIAVAIRAGISSSQVFTVSDSNHNTYRSALQLGITANPMTAAIFYAENINGGANTVTVSDTVAGPLRVAILEYSGVATSSSLDVSIINQGTSTAPNSNSATTTANGDLLLGEVVTVNSATFTPAGGYTIEQFVPAEPSTKLIVEDQIQTAAGSASAGATLAASDNWGAGLAAFKAAAGGGPVAPNISSLSQTTGAVGTPITISGSNFGSTQGNSTVTFNGTSATPTNWSATSIAVPVPTGATTGNVVVTVGGVNSNGITFTVTAAPTITNLSQASGPVGTPITITGANFGSNQGTSTVTFNGTVASPTSWNSTTIGVPVPTGATTGNVVVTVGGVASNGVNFTVTTASTSIKLVQTRSLDAGSTSTASLPFTTANTAGNWIAVCIRAGGSASQTFAISDSNGNVYRQAYQLAIPSGYTISMYYAENVKPGANTVVVSDTFPGPLRFSILEYSGVALSNSIDAFPVVAQGTTTAPNSGSLTTGANGDLLLATIATTNAAAYTAGSGFTIESFVPAEPNSKLIVEDQLQATAGTVSAGATLGASDTWGAGFAAFRSGSGVALPITIAVAPGSVTLGSGAGTQNFTASITNDYANLGVTWSLSGAGCSGSTCGTLSNITSTSVTYNAPAFAPSPNTVILQATAVADGTKTGTATITVNQGPLSVSVTPKRAAVTMSVSQTVQFTGTVFNDPSNSGLSWEVDGNFNGTPASGTISTNGLYTPGTQPGLHTVTAVSKANANVSASATVAVTDLTGVYTYHNDNARTGQNLQEYALTTATVNSSTFGKLFSCPVDGYLFASPLYVANLTVGAQVHNVVFLATSHDSVYAFDADSASCTQLWWVSFLSNGVTTVPLTDVNDGSQDMFPEIGITSTPVIDPNTNTLYVEAKTKDTVSPGCSNNAPCYFQRLHAMDLATGAEKFGGPTLITAPNFNSLIQLQRPGLLLSNNTVYIAFGSHGDRNDYKGWLMGYDSGAISGTLLQKFVTPLTNPTTPGNKGGVWQSGAGVAADTSGNVFLSTGNGSYDGNTNFGDTCVKLSPTGSILDWFTPFNQAIFNSNDIDLASGGVVLLPSSVGSSAHPNLAIASGKVAILYLLDVSQAAPGQTKMGKFNSSTNNDVQEVIPVPPPNTTQQDGGNYGDIAYWNGNIYTTGQNFPLSQFLISNGTITTPQTAQSTNFFPPRGGIPAVSSSGTTNGVVWIIDYSGWNPHTPAILDAYDATNVSTLLYSSPASGSGAASSSVKFTVPTVANGKVYVGGGNSFTVFGLLPN